VPDSKENSDCPVVVVVVVGAVVVVVLVVVLVGALVVVVVGAVVVVVVGACVVVVVAFVVVVVRRRVVVVVVVVRRLVPVVVDDGAFVGPPVVAVVELVVVANGFTNGLRVTAPSCSGVVVVVVEGTGAAVLTAGRGAGAALPGSSLPPDSRTKEKAPPATSRTATPTTGTNGRVPNLPAKPGADAAAGGGSGWLMRSTPTAGSVRGQRALLPDHWQFGDRQVPTGP
jgi:hypothetical protein